MPTPTQKIADHLECGPQYDNPGTYHTLKTVSSGNIKLWHMNGRLGGKTREEMQADSPTDQKRFMVRRIGEFVMGTMENISDESIENNKKEVNNYYQGHYLFGKYVVTSNYIKGLFVGGTTSGVFIMKPLKASKDNGNDKRNGTIIAMKMLFHETSMKKTFILNDRNSEILLNDANLQNSFKYEDIISYGELETLNGAAAEMSKSYKDEPIKSY